MSEQLNAPSQVSIGNSLAAPEFTSDTGFTNAPVWRDFESMAIAPTGEQQALDFLNEPYDPSWPEPKKNRWEEYNFGEVATTPAAAAQRTLADMDAERKRAATMQDEQMKAQREREAQANTPQAQADLKNKMATTAATQLELQEAYRQEIEYQRSLTTLNDPAKSSAERNAARMQLEALAVSIGKRMNPKLGTSESANKQAKNLAGYIGPIEFKMPYSDFAPRAQTMQRGSEERLGLYRQQMEAAGVPLPEMAVPEAPPSPEQIASQMAQAAIQKRGLKGPDGNLLTVAAGEGQSPQPIVARMRGGKKEYRRVGPDGLFYPLTPDQIKALGLK
jgi:hypothetical protein